MKPSRQVRHSVLLFFAMALGATFVSITGYAQTYTILHAFNNRPDGDSPQAGVTLDAAGDIFGTAIEGGLYHKGTAWRVDANGAFSVLYTFNGGVGSLPDTPLLLDGKGNLYGTTSLGGHKGLGSVYSLSAQGEVKELWGFNSGGYPQGRLALDPHRGILYGAAASGGTAGTAWRLSPMHRFVFLHRFAGPPDGAIPISGLIRNAGGELYGATHQGGQVTQQCQQGCGTVFKINSAGKESILYSFQGAGDGIGPAEGDLIWDSSGNLYGTTAGGGGANACGYLGCGTVYKITPSGQETVLYGFQGGSDGMFPNGGLVLDGNGGVYGSTPSTLFHLDSPGKLTTIYSQPIDCSNGCDFNPDLAIDSAGALYGTTSFGGDLNCHFGRGCGVVFKFVP